MLGLATFLGRSSRPRARVVERCQRRWACRPEQASVTRSTGPWRSRPPARSCCGRRPASVTARPRHRRARARRRRDRWPGTTGLQRSRPAPDAAAPHRRASRCRCGSRSTSARLTAALRQRRHAPSTPPSARGRSRSPEAPSARCCPSPGARWRSPRTASGGGCRLAPPGRRSTRSSVRRASPRSPTPEIRRAVAAFARPAVSGPLTVKVGSLPIVLTPAKLRLGRQPAADAQGRLRPHGRRRQGHCAAARGRTRGREAARRRHGAAGRRPAVRRSPPWRAPRYDAAGGGGRGAARADLAGADRDGEPVRTQPKVTTATARGRGVTQVVSTFSTEFPVNPPRTTNITIAARTLDGTLVKPGETFSLNGVLGQRTAAKGYQKAPVINGGRLETDYGGGVSRCRRRSSTPPSSPGADRAAHPALVLHLALPRGPRGDGLLARRRQPVDQRQRLRRS